MLSSVFVLYRNDSILKTVVAFANTDGGCICIGIEDDGTVVGVADVDDVQKRVISLCRDGIQTDVMMVLSCDRTVIEENHNFWYRIMQLR